MRRRDPSSKEPLVRVMVITNDNTNDNNNDNNNNDNGNGNRIASLDRQTAPNPALEDSVLLDIYIYINIIQTLYM